MAEADTHPSSAPLTHEGHAILFPPLPYDMHERADAAVKDTALLSAIESATMGKYEGRKQMCARAFGDDYPAMRKLAGDIKQHTLDHLDFYLEQFIERAEATGAQVHFAADGAQANAICLEIAKRENCRSCVKSKSMVTEETGLVTALEGAGIETVESDLGEFIIQIDHDAPSHIVTPMIHKTRREVAAAYRRELGVDCTEDPEELTKIARKHLRDIYRKADLGVSGANFLVAEDGALVLCTNEGNATFSVTAPRVHVAFVGIEKLVPTRRHLAVMLKLLARSSTAQPITVYTDILTGPKRVGDAHGPEQMHIVLVDNGRSAILADPALRPSLRCIRCGACLNACPVYRKVGGHSYGAVYSGPIGAVITPLLRDPAGYKDLPNASSLCGACYQACPVHIDLPTLLIELRKRLVEQGKPKRIERLMYRAYAASLKSPWRYKLSQWLGRKWLRMTADRDGFVHRTLPPGRAWTDHRDLPAPAKQSFHQWWRKEKGTKAQRHEGKSEIRNQK